MSKKVTSVEELLKERLYGRWVYIEGKDPIRVTDVTISGGDCWVSLGYRPAPGEPAEYVSIRLEDSFEVSE